MDASAIGSNATSLDPAEGSGALALSRRHLALLAVILTLALAVRLLWGLKLGASVRFGDEGEYMDGARRLLSGEGLARHNWMLFVRAPGYSLFIAAIWKVVGHESVAAIRVVQAVLGTGTCAAVFALSRAVGASSRSALVATALTGAYPYLIYYVALLGTEGPFAFFVAAGSFCLVSGLAPATPNLSRLAVGGLLLGAGNLMRPNMTTVLPCLALWFAYRYRSRLVLAVKSLVALALPIVVLAIPWSIAVHDAGLGWVWVTDGGPVWYYMGHNDDAYEYMCGNPSEARRKVLLRFPGSDQFPNRADYKYAASLPLAERQPSFMRAAQAWDKAHLGAQPCLAVNKLHDYWRPWVNLDAYPVKVFLVSLLAAPVMLLGAAGTVIAFRRGERTGSVYAWIIALTGTLVAVAFSTEIRYRIPMVDVLLLPFTGVALDRLLASRRAQQVTP
jgi:hypothetical protein